MTRTRTALTALLLLALPATAASADTKRFRDSVIKPGKARAAAFSAWRFTAPDGHTIRLRLSREIDRDPAAIARAESYALALEDKLHGGEMSDLTITVVTMGELGEICGDGALACYGGDEMFVPFGDYDPEYGVSVEEVLTHEYGHHLAAHRSNSLGPAIDWGPQSWASYESVCRRADEGRLHPGNQWDHYWDNPGEAWAEAYARYHFRGGGWDYSRLLRPDAGSFERVAFDAGHVLDDAPSRTVFRGRLGPGRRMRTFTLAIPEDTALNLRLRGPRRANYDLRLKTPGYYDEVTRGRGARDRLSTTACFAPGDRRTVRIRVTRKRGFGAFRLVADRFDRYVPVG